MPEETDTTKAPVSPSDSHGDAQQVLIVEDSSTDARILQGLLKNAPGHSFQSRVATNLAEALEVLNKVPFDICILDLGLPDSQEVDTVRQVTESFPDLPVVVMTGMDDQEIVSEALQLGAQDFLVKGRFNSELFVRSLNYSIERKRVQVELRRERDLVRNYLDVADMIIVALDTQGKILQINPKGQRVLGVSAEEVLGKDWCEVAVPENGRERVESLISRCLAGTSQEIEEGLIRDVTGTERVILWRTGSLTDASGRITGVVRAGTDITDQIAIGRQNRILVSAIESAAEAIEITDKQGNIQYVNPAFEKTTGYSREEVLGKNPRFLKSGEHSEKFYADLWKTLRSGYVWTGEFVNRRKDGSLFREEATISPVKDRHGEIASYIAVKRDLSKEIELKTRVNQLQRMQAVGLLAAGIAHDFNNILQAIMGYSTIIRERLGEDAELMEYSDRVLEGSKRGADLVRQLLAFSRQTAMKMSPIHLEIVVKEAIKLLRSTIPSPISIELEQPSNLPLVNADPSQIHQVLVNICVNSRDVMPDGGKIAISLEKVPVGGQKLVEEGCDPGDYVVLTISDTGPGISPENLPKVFDPFFTTKSEGQGTGLGLSTCYGIVKQHGGFLEVVSKIGKGSTFRIYLPALEVSEKIKEGPPPIERVSQRSDGRILVVDDEPYILDIAARTLRKVGFEVLTAPDGEKALELLKSDQYRGFIDLVVLDFEMPGRTGIACLGEIHAIEPDLPVILSSGFLDNRRIPNLSEIPLAAFLQKPYSPHDLIALVSKILGNSSDQ